MTGDERHPERVAEHSGGRRTDGPQRGLRVPGRIQRFAVGSHMQADAGRVQPQPTVVCEGIQKGVEPPASAGVKPGVSSFSVQ
ncbi:MAG: hypothetical protein ACO23T_07775 [Hylemonella sp.]